MNRREVVIYFYNLGYRVADDGKLIYKNKEVRTHIAGGRYLRYATTVNLGYRLNVRVNFDVHRLAAYQKYGKALFGPGVVTRHKNNIKTDNSPENILIGSHRENRLDIPRHLRRRSARKGSRSCRLFTNAQALQIRRMSKEGKTNREIADLFKVCITVIYSIVINKKYRISPLIRF